MQWLPRQETFHRDPPGQTPEVRTLAFQFSPSYVLLRLLPRRLRGLERRCQGVRRSLARRPCPRRPRGNVCLRALETLGIGCSLFLAFHAAGDASRRQIARDCIHRVPGQVVAQFRVAVASEKMPEIFARIALGEVAAQKSLDGFWNLSRQAAISDRTRDGLMQTHRSAQAEVVGIHHLAVDFHFLAFDSDVSDPMLTAAVRATCYV